MSSVRTAGVQDAGESLSQQYLLLLGLLDHFQDDATADTDAVERDLASVQARLDRHEMNQWVAQVGAAQGEQLQLFARSLLTAATALVSLVELQAALQSVPDGVIERELQTITTVNNPAESNPVERSSGASLSASSMFRSLSSGRASLGTSTEAVVGSPQDVGDLDDVATAEETFDGVSFTKI